MKAAVYESFQGPITIKSVPDPKPKADGVIVKVEATGLCRSDWHGWMGHDPDIKLPHVPGHELAGTIVEVGNEIKTLKIGDRITVPFVSGCGTCSECLSGNQQVCDHQSQPGFTHFGSFAEYVTLDYADTNVVQLPDTIDFVTAASLGCRFITAFRAIVYQGKTQADQCVAVHGCGGVGLSAIMIAKALGAQVIAIDINHSTLELATRVGADFILNGMTSSVHLIKAIKEISKGGVHVSVDALGSEQTCLNSILSLKKRGKHVQVGLMTEDHKNPRLPMDLVLAHELELIGSHGMQAYKYPEMFQMISDGKLRPEQLIERTVSLEDITKLLPKMNDFEHSGVLIVNQF